MFERLGGFALRRAKPIIAVTILFVIVAGAIGGGVADRLSIGGFEDPNSEAVAARATLETEFGSSVPNFVLVVEAPRGSVDDPGAAEAGLELAEELRAREGIGEVVSYWETGIPAFRSLAGNKAMVLGLIEGDEDLVRDRVEILAPEFTRDEGPLEVRVTGFAEVFRQVGTTIEADLARAEAIAIPITLLALIFVFGSVVAATLPLVVGLISIVGSFLILSAIAEVTQVSIFSLNMVTAMGLGLAIDYSLFIVSRYREELHAGAEVADAIKITVRTAGRTVFFSGITVALSLGALIVFPLAFLRSFAYAGIAVVTLAMVSATVFLPAFLAVLGPRIEKLSVRKRKVPTGEGGWHRVAMFVMRRPIPIATVVTAFLLFLGIPFLGVEFGLPDDRVLPSSASAQQAAQEIRRDFVVDASQNISVVSVGLDDAPGRLEEVGSYASELSRLDDVFAVQAATGTYVQGEKVSPPNALSARQVSPSGTYLTIVPTVEAISPEAEDLVRRVRGTEAPFEFQVAGSSAELVDAKKSLFSRLPLAAGLIGLTTLVLMFLMFGGLLVPIKAIILNLLSLTATFGAMVWIFQDGNLSGQLDFIVTGVVDVTTPILMFCIAFGLSMDYEVFMLSRIKEEYDRSGDNTASVALGLERTGRIITAAALILSIVFIATAASSITFIKLFGIGLTLAIVVDATLVRATLVPAFMRLAGRANWWAPKWMRSIHDRFGISEGGEPPDASRLAEPAQQGSAS